MSKSLNSFNCYDELIFKHKTYSFFNLQKAEKNGLDGISQLPLSIKILLENLLRNEDGKTVTKNMILSVAGWIHDKGTKNIEIAYRPTRVLMQDFTGVPAIVDLAVMRDAMVAFKKNPETINPQIPVDLIIDHSLIVDNFGQASSLSKNVSLEHTRNIERYRFLKWGQNAFQNLRIVPPGGGICHQINLEYLAKTVWSKTVNDKTMLFPDTCIGTDSHTTMINGLGVLGWGVGGIEAEASMLGQPVSMLLPEVIGFKLTGHLKEGITSTDLVLTITEILRKKGVIGKFVEFYGEGLSSMGLADRATISNMAPEYGATCGFFPVDQETIRYLNQSGRDSAQVELTENYCKTQGLWRDSKNIETVYTDTLHLDLNEVVCSMSGPRRPEEKAPIQEIAKNFTENLTLTYKKTKDQYKRYPVKGENFSLGDGDVVIAAITSCTNTSNPFLLIGAGLLARNANQKGLKTQPWVKTSLAPGSQIVAEYLKTAGLQEELNKLGFNIVGFACTTCIGNAGPLEEKISQTIHENNLIVASVLSGNRNFEGRISPDVHANYLASPLLVIAHALTGTVHKDLTSEPIGNDSSGNPVYLKDIWPSHKEINQFIEQNINRDLFLNKYANLFDGDEIWQKLECPKEKTYTWDNASTYVRKAPYFNEMNKEITPPADIISARILALFGDKITTDHISPAGSIKPDSPAGIYLLENNVKISDFNQYGTRRGNHEVMIRGTFANIRIYNHMMEAISDEPKKGGFTIHYPSGKEMPIYDAAMEYKKEQIPLVVFSGIEYGNGSSRDWAAKGPYLLGVKAVIAESFERIHRSNLIGMGILPLIFAEGMTWKKIGLKGDETVDIKGINNLKPKEEFSIDVFRKNGEKISIKVICRIDTQDELDYYRNGGILQYVLRGFIKE